MREEWSQVMAGRIRFRTATIDPRELPRVFGTACPAALATTLTLTLSHGQDGNLRVRALMRVDDVLSRVVPQRFYYNVGVTGVKPRP